MLRSLRARFSHRARLALDYTPWGGRAIQARRARRARDRQEQVGREADRPFVIELPDLTGRALRPVYLERRGRYATATSVKLMDPETLVCASFLEKKLYLVRFDLKRKTSAVLDEIATTYRGVPVETDLADVDPSRTQIVLSNFHHGSFSHFRRVGDRLEHVQDLDSGLDSKVHGVKFLSNEIVAGTLSSEPGGVQFFSLFEARPMLRVDVPRKAQDVEFLGPNEMLVFSVHGAPRRERQSPYATDVARVRFDLERGSSSIVETQTWSDTHIDACARHGGRLFLTDQRNDCVLVVDPATLAIVQTIGGFDFPHGIDIGFDLLAVSNYGSNTVELRALAGDARGA